MSVGGTPGGRRSMPGRGWGTALAAALVGGALFALSCLPQPAPATRTALPSASRMSPRPSTSPDGTPAARIGNGPLRTGLPAAPSGTALATASAVPGDEPTVSASASGGATTAAVLGGSRQRTARGDQEFLPLDSCAARTSGDWSQVACDSSGALARVIDRFPAGSGSACPADTDYALAVSTIWSGGGTVADGTACLRTLRAPHPSDPGRGGGIGIVVGDCLYGTGGTAVRETACDGSTGAAPQYRVIAIVPLAQLLCPLTTDLLITIQNPGEPKQNACAVKL